MQDAIYVPNLQFAITGVPSGSPKYRALLRDLIDVSIDEDIDKTTELTLSLSTWNDKAFTWVDDEALALGTRIEIKLGYGGDLATLFCGDILDLDLRFGIEEPPTLTLKGQDVRHVMARENNAVTYLGLTDFEVASTVARKHRLNLKGSGGGGAKSEMVIQHEQSDLAFLYELARANGWVFTAQGETLFFGPLLLDGKPALTLSPQKDLISFSSSVNSNERFGKVVVRGDNPNAKTAIVAEAPIGQKLAGLLSRDKVNADGIKKIEDPSLKTEESVRQRARVDAVWTAANYLTASCTCFGNNLLRVGQVVEIEGVGKRFGQKYVVTSARHSYSVSGGYRTTIQVRGNAWNP